MQINPSSLSSLLSKGYDVVSTQVGQWVRYHVKWIHQVPYYLQNHWLAILGLVGINAICFELAVSTSRVAHHLLNQQVPYDALQSHPHERDIRAIELGMVFLTTIGLANWGFAKAFRLPVSGITIVATATLTGFITLFLRTRE